MSTMFVRAALLVLFAWYSMPEASAAKIMLITTGDTITSLGRIKVPPPKPKDSPQAEDEDAEEGFIKINGLQIDEREARKLEVGYKWSYAGIFWCDFWTWGGEYCVFKGNTYDPISYEDAVALLGEKNPPSRPILYQFPPGIGLIVLGVIVATITVIRRRRAEKTDPTLDEFRKPLDEPKPLDETKPHEG